MNYKQFREISQTDACYFAGYFDGEGTISIYGNRCRGDVTYDLKIAISCTFESILRRMVETLGGACQEHKWKVPRLGRARQWVWQVSSREAAHVLKNLLPYLFVKRDEAELAVRLQEHVRANCAKMHSRDLKARAALRLERAEMLDELKRLRAAKLQYPQQTGTVQ